MNQYTIVRKATSLDEGGAEGHVTETLEADDWTLGDGFMVFRDEDGFAIAAYAVGEVLALDAVLDEDLDSVKFRRRTAVLERANAERSVAAAEAPTTLASVPPTPTHPGNRAARRRR